MLDFYRRAQAYFDTGEIEIGVIFLHINGTKIPIGPTFRMNEAGLIYWGLIVTFGLMLGVILHMIRISLFTP